MVNDLEVHREAGDEPALLDKDMIRLKSLLEEGKTSADEGQIHLNDLTAAPADRPLAGR